MRRVDLVVHQPELAIWIRVDARVRDRVGRLVHERAAPGLTAIAGRLHVDVARSTWGLVDCLNLDDGTPIENRGLPAGCRCLYCAAAVGPDVGALGNLRFWSTGAMPGEAAICGP